MRLPDCGRGWVESCVNFVSECVFVSVLNRTNRECSITTRNQCNTHSSIQYYATKCISMNVALWDMLNELVRQLHYFFDNMKGTKFWVVVEAVLVLVVVVVPVWRDKRASRDRWHPGQAEVNSFCHSTFLPQHPAVALTRGWGKWSIDFGYVSLYLSFQHKSYDKKYKK